MALVLICSFLAMTSLMVGLGYVSTPSPIRARIDRLRADRRDGDTPHSLLPDLPDTPVGRIVAGLAGRKADDASDPTVTRTRARLLQAGYRSPAQLRFYLGSRIAFAILLPLLVLTWPFADGLTLTERSIGTLLAGGLGLILPSFLLDRRIARRRLAIEEGLPDALDLMVVCIEAGLGLGAAIARVADEYKRSNSFLAEEFALVALEAQAGKSTVEALRGLADRTDLPELSSLVAMLIQTERFGTSVADALRVQADGMRRRRILRAEEAASKAPLKMLFPAGLFIFPAILLLIAGPGVMRLIETLTSG